MLSFSVFSQNDYRTWIKGKVLYQNTNVAAANVINNTSQQATTTNSDGEFEIEVKLNDRLLFSSVQYQIRELIITKEILQKNRIVIDVNEKVTELDEVVVTPENRQKFLDLKEEEFKRFDYSSDKSTRVVNVINEQGKLRNGINFINLYKLISESLKNKTSESEVNFSYNPSDLLREVYDDLFFTNSLGINKDKINEFLLFCDDNFPSKILLKKENEFELISGMEPNDDNFLKFNEEIPCNLIVTLGEKGAVLVDENKTHYFDAPSVNAIDTTGAGDSFIGTFAYELSESNSPESCIKKAVEKASQSVTKKGTQSSYS